MKKSITAWTLTAVLLVTLLSGCNSGNSSLVNGDREYGYLLDQIHFDLGCWGNEKDIEWANSILAGNLYIWKTFDTPVSYDMRTLDWNMEETDSPASFQLYLQSLGMIRFLCMAALETKNTEYLECAAEFIKSWNLYAHDESRSANNTKVWYDHGTALRADSMIYYLLVCHELQADDADMQRLCKEILTEHAEFLADEANYTKNHNHGIFQDEALLYIAYLLPEAEQNGPWKELAKERLAAQLDYAFTDEWVHVENSSEYCAGVIHAFYNIALFCGDVHDSYGEELTGNIKQMADYVARLYKPDQKYIVMGDSFVSGKSSANTENYGNSFLEYVYAGGEQGTPPESLSAYYPHSGYFFVNETYEKDRFADSTWAMFKAGWTSATHKHADDLSIDLFSKGHDIFIDPGMYNYMSGDAYRDYLVSPRAHNTVNVDGLTYSVTAENGDKAGLLTYEVTDTYRYVLGYNELYDGVAIDRHFYSLTDAIVLFDDIQSDSPHTYSQLFQLSEDMSIISQSAEETVLAIADTGYRVRIRQFGITPDLEAVRGGEKDPIYGWASDKLNEVYAINTLKYELTAANAQFITLITIEDENGRIKLFDDESETECWAQSDDCRYDEQQKLLQVGDAEIQLTERVRLLPKDTTWSMEDGTLTVTATATDENAKYLWYVIDADTGSVLERGDWSESPTCTYSINGTGDICIKLYTMDKYGQRRSMIVGRWDRDGNMVDVSVEELNYRHLTDEVQQSEGNTYRFTAGMDYALPYSLRWYIYRNGSYYAVESINDDNVFEFELAEPGNYTASYYVKTTNGDYEYWVFPQIIIE